MTDRKVYFDYLRVFATLAVMVLHIAASNWHTTDVNGFAWQVFNFFDSMARWCVPVFVMISGALFLNRDVPLKRLYTKYILRMVAAFVVWSAVYVLFMDGTAKDRAVEWMQGHYHLWFVLMITGIYMCIPFIKPIAVSASKMKYYFVLSLLFAFVVPELFLLAKDFGNDWVICILKSVKADVKNMHMHMVLGFVFYFLLGYYLDKREWSKRQRMAAYALGIMGFAFTVVVDLVVALRTQTCCGKYYGNFTVNVLLEAVAVFVFFKYGEYDCGRLNAIMQTMSGYSFGAYLVHALVLEQLNVVFGLNTLSFNPVFAVFVIAGIVFAVSFAISALLHRIPLVKVYLV